MQMTSARLEHVNITVSDPERTATMLCELFGSRVPGRIRWQGPSQMGGRTVHVGNDDDYLAVYCRADEGVDASFDGRRGQLNHVGVLVDDLDAVEARVLAAGFSTKFHGDYEPGRRFYFDGPDGVEYEVVSYAPRTA